jgi:hypothetical protein
VLLTARPSGDPFQSVGWWVLHVVAFSKALATLWVSASAHNAVRWSAARPAARRRGIRPVERLHHPGEVRREADGAPVVEEGIDGLSQDLLGRLQPERERGQLHGRGHQEVVLLEELRPHRAMASTADPRGARLQPGLIQHQDRRAGVPSGIHSEAILSVHGSSSTRPTNSGASAPEPPQNGVASGR